MLAQLNLPYFVPEVDTVTAHFDILVRGSRTQNNDDDGPTRRILAHLSLIGLHYVASDSSEKNHWVVQTADQQH